MNLPLYIAKRYLFSKKNKNAVNIISLISVIGVMVGTSALIIVLSVFNGFDSILKDLNSSFDPDLKITYTKSKTFEPDSIKLDNLLKIENIDSYCLSIEENALFEFNSQQIIASIKGVDDNFNKVTAIEEKIIEGTYLQSYYNKPTATIGYSIANRLGLSLNSGMPIKVHIPSRTAKIKGNVTDASRLINTKFILPTGYFAIQQDYDSKYVLVPLKFAQEILEYENDISSIEIKLKDYSKVRQTQNKIKEIFGNDYKILDKEEQHEFLYKVMQTEKWAIFVILIFIIIIASFNLVASLSMLIIEKKKDIEILQSIGFERKYIRQIFFFQGIFITFIGAILGLIFGGLICYLQEKFGVIGLGQGSYIINAYPVKVQIVDFIIILINVVGIGLLASWVPVKYLTKKIYD